ncbi:MAG: NRDE family protein [Candidatus Marinimicrobia bacterium]|nr:NRDE family protein [Candidatus Neomarinimicrobiota bacterium]
MCTLLIRHDPKDPYPLALLANRDERYDRQSEGWAWRTGRRPYFAPRDQQAGGTWIGLNDRGVVVALTNIFPGRQDDAHRSRGALVIDMLGLARAGLAPDALGAAVKGAAYNDFNLLVADPAQAYLFTWQNGELRQFELAPGVTTVGNDPFDDVFQPLGGQTNEAWLSSEAGYLKQHPQVCKHGEGYGTRCSHKLLVHGRQPGRSKVWHLEGHPCRHSFDLVLAPKEPKEEAAV